MAIRSHSSSSSIPYGFTYQVFLSFRGSDTRDGFTGHLYKALDDKGIHTFIDDCDLERGEEITSSFVKVIEESKIFIPVFSINYASSSFCLDELVHVIYCYKTKGRLVLPVFFGVDPTDVRHYTGSYGEDLTKHGERFQNNKNNMERLHHWKIALTQAANLSGYHYSPGYEYKFIQEIIKDISDRINRVFLHVAKYPIGLQSQVQQVKLLLDKGYDDKVHMVGLYGTGGLGKSTLAKAIYNFIADQFEGLCFLEDVRENSTPSNLKHLQEELLLKTVRSDIKLGGVSEGITIIKQRLHRKKILLILDDVDKLEQLEALAGGLDWFGRGSRVIITTRDKHLLTCHGIESMHAVKGLYGTKALELLRWMAFKHNKVPSSYDDVLNRAVSYASGLPLVIEIVGSNLFGKSIEEWKGTLDGYEKIPNKKIQEIFKVSYDALEEEEKKSHRHLPFSFQNLNELRVLTLFEGGMFRFSSNFFMMPNLSKIYARGCRLLLPKHKDILSSTVASNVEHLVLQNNNLSDECVRVVLTLCANVKYLHLSDNTIKILPECLNKCHLLRVLRLDYCKSPEEIRGIPPNLENFSAIGCESLTSSCRRMLLSQQLHEAGCIEICLPTGTEGIPDWFQHQSWGQTISFWFRKEIPSISFVILCCYPIPSIFILGDIELRVKLCINGYEHTLSHDWQRRFGFHSKLSDHAYLFDLKLEKLINSYNQIFGNLVCDFDEALLKNEWIQVELEWRENSQGEKWSIFERYREYVQIGIHVLMKKRSTEENVTFTNPYRKRKLDEYLNTSLSQFHTLLKKQRSMGLEVSETESVHEQSSNTMHKWHLLFYCISFFVCSFSLFHPCN